MSGRPLLLIDVDGVLNCFGSLWTPAYEEEHFTSFMADRFTIRVRKETRAQLERLLPFFEPVWCTAWMERAHPAFRECLGLPEEPWPHIEFTGWNGMLAPGGSWKRSWVHRFVGDRPFVWLDDDLGEADYMWAANRSAPSLLMQTPPHDGLRESHVDLVLTWLQTHFPPDAGAQSDRPGREGTATA